MAGQRLLHDFSVKSKCLVLLSIYSLNLHKYMFRTGHKKIYEKKLVQLEELDFFQINMHNIFDLP